jgi:hypothetical protein
MYLNWDFWHENKPSGNSVVFAYVKVNELACLAFASYAWWSDLHAQL